MAFRRQILLLTLALGIISIPTTAEVAYQTAAVRASGPRTGIGPGRKTGSYRIELRQAAASAPRDSEILTTLGTVLAMQYKMEESTQVFRTALKISPTGAPALSSKFSHSFSFVLHFCLTGPLSEVVKRFNNSAGGT
jgi:hypothetical protein